MIYLKNNSKRGQRTYLRGQQYNVPAGKEVKIPGVDYETISDKEKIILSRNGWKVSGEVANKTVEKAPVAPKPVEDSKEESDDPSKEDTKKKKKLA